MKEEKEIRGFLATLEESLVAIIDDQKGCESQLDAIILDARFSKRQEGIDVLKWVLGKE